MGGEHLFDVGVSARGLLQRAPERGRETGGHEGEHYAGRDEVIAYLQAEAHGDAEDEPEEDGSFAHQRRASNPPGMAPKGSTSIRIQRQRRSETSSRHISKTAKKSMGAQANPTHQVRRKETSCSHRAGIQRRGATIKYAKTAHKAVRGRNSGLN